MCDQCFDKLAYIKQGDCLLENAEGRCKNYLTCKHYEKCLDLAADKNWDGWRTVYGC